MSVPFSGTLRRSGGIVSAIGKQLKSINLKGVKRITVQFDPFAENVKSTREFFFLLSTPKVVQTNPKCVVKSDIVCDRQPASIKFSLIDAAQEQAQVKEIRFNSSNLNTLELLELCNKHVSSLAPPEEVTNKVLTKAEKQKLGGGSKKVLKKK
ncbi:39S ribosomal protein L53, mitochondrial [Drosophila guanche]|uniref:39S ribosomal protein L53, mitochondrial n=1 Tax=Drosophila guanche TaxID=7266 RepID=UPI001471B993|nr:39S ribosomal protein L53, mitochondrial [Drosophila guanche]XP_034652298.1 39S ribosomal protein L53, mitochondrial [Drosophila subobscura]